MLSTLSLILKDDLIVDGLPLFDAAEDIGEVILGRDIDVFELNRIQLLFDVDIPDSLYRGGNATRSLRFFRELADVLRLNVQLRWIEDVVFLRHHHTADFLLPAERCTDLVEEEVVDLLRAEEREGEEEVQLR